MSKRKGPVDGGPQAKRARADDGITVQFAFHASTLAVAPSAKSVHLNTVNVAASDNVRVLAHTLVESVSAQCHLRVAALVDAKNERILSFDDEIGQWLHDGDLVLVLADVGVAATTMDTDPALVPITILTGFLGSGKTTTLNHLLHVQSSKRIAVIENEFGEVPLDNELLQTSKMSLAEQVVVLDNGCMCCTVRGDLFGAFEQILKKIDDGNPVDEVVIETTGMADPLPIVRTLLTTPLISARFCIGGVVTLVDAKNIAARLKEAAEDPLEGREVSEAVQQIIHADLIVINKIDLACVADVADIFVRVRSMNATALLVTSSRGRLDPALLRDARVARDTLSQDNHEHEHDHQHDHEHDHDQCGEDCSHDAPQSRHRKQVTSFSLVYPGSAVNGLVFARWVRQLATAPPERGVLYRCKAVLAVHGSPRKLVFHSVCGVTEKSEACVEWGVDDERVCKIVFIGKSLDKEWLTEGFKETLSPARRRLRSEVTGEDHMSLLVKAAPRALYSILLCLSSRDAARLGLASTSLADAVYGDMHLRHVSALARGPSIHPGNNLPRSLHLHGHLPMASIARYVAAMRTAGIQSLPYKGLAFESAAEAEAAGITWMEMSDLRAAAVATGAKDDTAAYVVNFCWREETLAEFFASPTARTSSTLVKVEYEVDDEDAFDAETDVLRFRCIFEPDKPETTDNAAEDTRDQETVPLQRLVFQLTGGRTSSQVYLLSFHTIHPLYQIHVPVEDHRIPMYRTKELFHRWHPLMEGLRTRPHLSVLVRVKPDGSGPLGEMCGCC